MGLARSPREKQGGQEETENMGTMALGCGLGTPGESL